MTTVDSFGSKGVLDVKGAEYEIFRLNKVEGAEKLPYSLKVLLENLLRTEDGANVTAEQIKALASWNPDAQPDTEIQFTPARVIMQDFTGVPCIVDLATMREAIEDLGGDAARVNPLSPAELVIDHSVQIDSFGNDAAIERNMEIEYERNGERYKFLRWGQTAFDDFKVVPPGMGIVHQVNIENLARTVMTREVDGVLRAYPDSCVGTDSHTTMVNGLGVLGWGVGGIEAEAAMLGQPVSMLIPRVVGFKLTGSIPAGATATDVVLTITEMLRQHGVVGKFVEFYGEGVGSVPLANRATIGNMSPEFGSTAAIFPIDDVTLDYLRLTGRPQEQIDLVEAYAKAQGLWHDPDAEPRYSEKLELDLSTVVPSIAGPKRPQDRIVVSDAKTQFDLDVKNYGVEGNFREVEVVIEALSAAPVPELRNGGLGVREMKKLAKTTGIGEPRLGLVLEVAASAGLVAPGIPEPEPADGSGPFWAPTPAADRFVESSAASRWYVLASTWLDLTARPSLIGDRGPDGKPYAALSDSLFSTAAPLDRRLLLGMLADLPRGSGVDATRAAAALLWRRPLSER